MCNVHALALIAAVMYVYTCSTAVLQLYYSCTTAVLHVQLYYSCTTAVLQHTFVKSAVLCKNISRGSKAF